jgi:hypothetical protein
MNEYNCFITKSLFVHTKGWYCELTLLSGCTTVSRWETKRALGNPKALFNFHFTANFAS